MNKIVLTGLLSCLLVAIAALLNALQNPEELAQAIASGADLNAGYHSNGVTLTPLQLAQNFQYERMIRLLREYGAQ